MNEQTVKDAIRSMKMEETFGTTETYYDAKDRMMEAYKNYKDVGGHLRLVLYKGYDDYILC